jgi:hypothetical protein
MTSSLRGVRRVAVATLAASVVLAVASAPALAGTPTNPYIVALNDAHHDVWASSLATGANAFTPVPVRAAGDITRTTMRHGTSFVVLNSFYRRLAPTGKGDIYSFTLRTETGLQREVVITAVPGNWSGVVTVSRRDGTPVKCGTMVHGISYATDKVFLAVSRSCLGNPRSVQLRAASVHITAGGKYLVDNPYTAKPEYVGWSRWVGHP